MKILYLAQVRFPTEKAHGWQIAKMCEAFVQAGASLELCTAKRISNTAGTDPFSYYQVPAFPWRELSCIDLATRGIRLGGLSSLVQQISFAFSTLKVIRNTTSDVVYTRDILAAWLASYVHKNVALELHVVPSRRHFMKFWCARIKHIIVITKAIQQELITAGVSESSILVSPDGVDLSLFAHLPDQNSARRELELPLTERLVLYTGHLYTWKGVYTLAHASALLDAGTRVIVVGGTASDSVAFDIFLKQQGLDRVTHISHQPPTKIPLFLAAADVVVLPNSASAKISRDYTSPLKLFEYMASGKPIVASDLPSIREILTKDMAMLVPADDPAAIAHAVNQLVCNTALANEYAQHSHDAVVHYSWSARAQHIMSHCNTEHV